MCIWGTPEAGVNDLRFDDDSLGDPNSGCMKFVRCSTNIESGFFRHRLQMETFIIPLVVAAWKFPCRQLEFFLLDTRGARQMHDTSRPHQPNLTMLGMDQRKWLMESMDKSDADFFFVVSSVPL